MSRLWFFAACMVAALAFVLGTLGKLPETVATHFGTNGNPDGWSQLDHYRVGLLFLLIVVPMLLVWLMAGLPRKIEGRGMIPHHEYWFASERRQATEQFLLAHAARLGILTIAGIVGLHIMILRAHESSPPKLNIEQFTTTMLVFLVGLGWWFFALIRHFQRITRT